MGFSLVRETGLEFVKVIKTLGNNKKQKRRNPYISTYFQFHTKQREIEKSANCIENCTISNGVLKYAALVYS